jgi:Spy/CpxP family protein refolding chaperone
MRKWKIMMILVSSVLLLALLVPSVGAQQGRLRNTRIQNALQALGARQLVAGLQLTQAQRDSIRSILQGYKNKILETRKVLLEARLALLKNDLDGPNQFGAAQARIMTLRQEILEKIKGDLTPEQMTILQQRQQRQADRIEKTLERMAKNGAN